MLTHFKSLVLPDKTFVAQHFRSITCTTSWFEIKSFVLSSDLMGVKAPLRGNSAKLLILIIVWQ